MSNGHRGKTADVIADHIRQPAKRRHQLVRVVGRYVAGRDLDGQRRTDARWSQAGIQTTEPYGHASRWASQPHRRRSAVRNGVLLVVGLLIAGLVLSPADTVTTLRVAVGLALAALGWVIVEKSRRWSHVQTYVVPTAVALAGMLDIPRRMDHRLWVHVPSDHRTDPDKQVVIDLPVTYTAAPAQQKRLADVAAKRLCMQSPDWSIDWEGDHPTLLLRACPSPPELVTFEQVRELAEQCSDGQFLLGLGSRMTPGSVSLAKDSAHILASIGSGGGKSQFGKWMALQALRRGSRIVIIDIVKRGASHKWAKGLPGVEIYRHPNTAHQALMDLSDLVETRCESYWHTGDSGTDQQVMLIIEESNRTVRKLQEYWANDLGQAKTSLAILAIEGILCVGREAGVNAVTVGQRMSATASGGGDARENYAVKLGNRFSRQTAKMLFDDVRPLPPNVTHPGRIQVVMGQTATEMQFPHLPDDDPAPVQWALAGAQQLPPREVAESVSRTPRELGISPTQEVGQVPTQRAGYLTVVPDPGAELVTLSQAAAVLGMPRKVLTNARDRDPEFPKLKGHKGQSLLYSLDEIRAWAPNRERADTAGGAS